MAITKTNIYSDDNVTNATNLYNFLLENAVPAYFDSVVLSDDGLTVSCYVGDLEFLKMTIPLSGTGAVTVQTNGGKSISLASNTSSIANISYAYKCNNGICLRTYGTYGKRFVFSVVKNNDGKTAIIFPHENDYNRNFDLTTNYVANSIYVVDADSDEISYIAAIMVTENNLTGIVPLPITDNGNRYTPNAFLIAYRQTMDEGILNINGVNYLSNGQWCIKDE